MAKMGQNSPSRTSGGLTIWDQLRQGRQVGCELAWCEWSHLPCRWVWQGQGVQWRVDGGMMDEDGAMGGATGS